MNLRNIKYSFLLTFLLMLSCVAQSAEKCKRALSGVTIPSASTLKSAERIFVSNLNKFNEDRMLYSINPNRRISLALILATDSEKSKVLRKLGFGTEYSSNFGLDLATIPSLTAFLGNYNKIMSDLVAKNNISPDLVIEPGLVIANIHNDKLVKVISFGDEVPRGWKPRDYPGELSFLEFFESVSKGLFPVDIGIEYLFDHDFMHFVDFLKSPKYMASFRKLALKVSESPELIEDAANIQRIYLATEHLSLPDIRKRKLISRLFHDLEIRSTSIEERVKELSSYTSKELETYINNLLDGLKNTFTDFGGGINDSWNLYTKTAWRNIKSTLDKDLLIENLEQNGGNRLLFDGKKQMLNGPRGLVRQIYYLGTVLGHSVTYDMHEIDSNTVSINPEATASEGDDLNNLRVSLIYRIARLEMIFQAALDHDVEPQDFIDAALGQNHTSNNEFIKFIKKAYPEGSPIHWIYTN